MHLAFLLRHPPYSKQHAREGLEAALAAAAFGQEVSLYFMGDGVLQLLPEQKAAQLAAKDTSKMLQALDMYDIENVYVDRTSLQARGIAEDALAIKCTAVDSKQIRQQLATAQQVFCF